jgi:hypothetical protein
MKKYLPIAVLLGCAAIFAFGVTRLVQLRFEHGDVYPPYSSLRADPLGTMAFYESLGKVPEVSVQRDFSETSARCRRFPCSVILAIRTVCPKSRKRFTCIWQVRDTNGNGSQTICSTK